MHTCRKALAVTVLVAEVEEETAKSLEWKNVALIENGWNNIHNDPVIASNLHVSGGKTIFLDFLSCWQYDSGTNVKNAEYHKDTEYRLHTECSLP